MLAVAEVNAIRDGLLALALALPRMLVCMLLVPVFSSGVLPRTIRIALALAFTLPVAVGIAHSPVEIGAPIAVIALIVKEGAVGVMLGLVLAAPFWAMDSVGALLDIQRGANTAQQLTPFAQGDASLIGTALQQALIAFLAVTGGISALYQLLLTSYQAWPVLSLAPHFVGVTAERFIGVFAELCELTLLYAMPILSVLILIDFCFALVGLFATQLQVYVAAMPVKSIVGLFVLALYLGILLDHGSHYFNKAVDVQMSIFHSAMAR
jgi:type III secretion protein T